MTTRVAVLALLAAALSVRAQLLHPKEPMPSFEVATVKGGNQFPSSLLEPAVRQKKFL